MKANIIKDIVEREQEHDNPAILFAPKLLTLFVLKDEDKFSAKCIELDLITEMDSPQAALVDLLAMIKEYAQDFSARISLFLKSPNRAHHHPYIEKVLQCKNDWELLERCEVRYGNIQL